LIFTVSTFVPALSTLYTSFIISSCTVTVINCNSIVQCLACSTITCCSLTVLTRVYTLFTDSSRIFKPFVLASTEGEDPIYGICAVGANGSTETAITISFTWYTTCSFSLVVKIVFTATVRYWNPICCCVACKTICNSSRAGRTRILTFLTLRIIQYVNHSAFTLTLVIYGSICRVWTTYTIISWICTILTLIIAHIAACCITSSFIITCLTCTITYSDPMCWDLASSTVIRCSSTSWTRIYTFLTSCSTIIERSRFAWAIIT
jgi:hypothetical protein